MKACSYCIYSNRLHKPRYRRYSKGQHRLKGLFDGNLKKPQKSLPVSILWGFHTKDSIWQYWVFVHSSHFKKSACTTRGKGLVLIYQYPWLPPHEKKQRSKVTSIYHQKCDRFMRHFQSFTENQTHCTTSCAFGLYGNTLQLPSLLCCSETTSSPHND